MSVPRVLPPTAASRTVRSHNILSIPLATTTPNESPASNCDFATKSQHKKVGFQEWTKTQDTLTPVSETSVKSLPPSRECQLNTKSILKNSSQTQNSEVGMDGQQEEKPLLEEAMDSVARQLARDDTAISIDAYSTLLRVLKTCDEIPEAAIFKNNIAVVLRCIRRDLNRKDKSYTAPGDTTIVTQALKVLTTVVWNRELSTHLSDDYKGFILDNSIKTIAEHSAPKSVIAHYLHLLAIQDFRQGLIAANNRSTRLIDALTELRHHVKGGNITSERLAVFVRLLDQARTIMYSKSAHWLEDMLQTMTSSIKDLRSKAIYLGTKACSAYPLSPGIATTVDDLLEDQMEDGPKRGALMCRRLEKMVREVDEGLHVPPVWSIVILLMSGRQGGVGKWASLEEWLKVIQRCFNSGESPIRLQTYYAWNRFVYAVRPHEATENLVSVLVKPIVAQLDKASTDRQSRSSRPAVLSSYCNLLYYAFRPAATHKQYTQVWNAYIVKVMTNSFFDRNAANADFACRIVMALLWNNSGQTKIWKENRAHENTPIDPEELPVVDCKWVRGQCRGILLMFKLLFSRSHWGPDGPPDQAFIATCWRNFAKALGEASRKEIKPSSETKQAIASLAEFLRELGVAGPQSVNVEGTAGDGSFLERLRFICQTMMLEIGTGPFIDSLEAGHFKNSHVLLSGLISHVTSSTRQPRTTVHVLAHSRDGSNANAPQLARLIKLLDQELSKAYGSTDQNDTNSAFLVESAIDCLLSPDDRISFTCLSGLAKSACLWLQDEMYSPRSESKCHLAYTATLRLAIVAALGLVESQSISAVDEVFAAAFGSADRQLVNEMVKTWNSTHGRSNELAYPPLLTTMLRRLQPYVEISLPGFGDTTTILENSDPPAFLCQLKYQDPSPREEHIPSKVSPKKSTRLQMSDNIGQETPQDPASADAEVQTGRVVTPTRSQKGRHDESQVNFVALDSSPPTHPVQDSQLLTERQREIRDRQKNEPIVFFPDLRSSPRPDKMSSRPPSRASIHAKIQDVPSTPVLPPQTSRDDEDLAALSPTPKRKQHVMQLEEVDVPSSPPSHAGILDDSRVEHDFHNAKLVEPDVTGPIRDDAGPELQNAEARDSHKNINDVTRLPTILQSQDEESHSSPNVVGIAPVETVAALNNVQKTQRKDPIATRIEASGKPTPEKDRNKRRRTKEREKEQADIVESSSPSHSNDIDQLSASQLSQDLNYHVNIGPSPSAAVPHAELLGSGHPGKRKHSSNHSTVWRSTKRRRSTYSLSPEPEQTEPVTEEKCIEDCIVVDMTPARVMQKRSNSSRSGSRRAESVVSHSSQTSTGMTGMTGRGRSRRRLRTQTTSSPALAPADRSSAAPANDDKLQQPDPQTATAKPASNLTRPHSPTQAPKESPSETEGIISSLQTILSQLKAVAGGSPLDLRRVDDLCFEIRTEAQNAVQRKRE